MSNNQEVAVSNQFNSMLSMWTDEEQLKTIKSMFAPKANDAEFKTFVQMGIALNLNPFLREIWCVKYDSNSAAQIFVGRDGYRRVISRMPEYNGHTPHAVYSNDHFQVDIAKGKIDHIPNLKDRGNLVGAYCIVYMKTVEIPFYVFVDLKEYNTGKSNWAKMPATMITKVAECQAIRMAASSTFSGTMSQEEEDIIQYHQEQNEKNSSKLNKRLEQMQSLHNTFEGSVNQETGEINTQEIHNPTEPKQEPELPFSIEGIKNKILAAKNVDELVQSVDLVNSLPGTLLEQKKELMDLFRSRKKEIGG